MRFREIDLVILCVKSSEEVKGREVFFTILLDNSYYIGGGGMIFFGFKFFTARIEQKT